jgi:hypothetical protein
MRREGFMGFPNNVCESALAHEHDHRQFRVPPAGVVEQLVDRGREALLA